MGESLTFGKSEVVRGIHILKSRMNGWLRKGSAENSGEKPHERAPQTPRAAELQEVLVWKIVAIVLLTASAILLAHLVYQAPTVPDPFGRLRFGHSRRRRRAAFAFADLCRGQAVAT
jgi:hypothetical protein